MNLFLETFESKIPFLDTLYSFLHLKKYYHKCISKRIVSTGLILSLQHVFCNSHIKDTAFLQFTQMQYCKAHVL